LAPAAKQSAGTATAANPFDHCQAQGYDTASDAFGDCMTHYVDETCRAAGPVATSEYYQCAEEQGDAALVRSQLYIRGY
jgi:hypothetical protein